MTSITAGAANCNKVGAAFPQVGCPMSRGNSSDKATRAVGAEAHLRGGATQR